MATGHRVGSAGTSRRERNKQRTHDALAAAALALFCQRGYDEVTVEHIAAEAGVSARTFFRYFPTKEDALYPAGDAQLERLRSLLAERPAGEPVVSALRISLLAMAADFAPQRDAFLVQARVINSVPALRAGSARRILEFEVQLAAMVAERLGADPALSLLARVVAASVVAALRVAIGIWLEGEGAADPVALLAEALDLVDGGLVQVQAGHAGGVRSSAP
ncbi:MAG TPA: TetR family transcriptional regulator [Acidimicrobiales bacterium]|nr:TetR family transcriptional regulator [Acidimicrobiales bacterium]